MGKDPYKIEGYENSERMRRFLKLVLLVALNSKSKPKAVKAIQKEINFNKDDFGWVSGSGIRLGDSIDDFAKIHEPIGKYFSKGIGTKLQRLDSMMAAYIINEMTKFHFPVLCIHDSFIVSISSEEFFRPLVIEAFQNAMHRATKTFFSKAVKATRVGLSKEVFDQYLSEKDRNGDSWSWISELDPLEMLKKDPVFRQRLSEHNKSKRPSKVDFYKCS